MAETAGKISWDLDLDDAKFKSKLKSSTGHAQSFGSKVGGVFVGIGKAALKMAAVAGAAFVGFSVLSVKAAAESDRVFTQLGAVLKSTGGVAGVTSEAAVDLSKSLQRVTTYSDEEILSAENLLLTFTKIGKKVFPQATEAILDMSTALGQDTKSSAIQLGKALQDPIRGVMALRKVGVSFSEKQQDVIKNLVETGRSLEAQKLILKEIQIEFGGSSRAAAKTFGGALKQLGNAVNDLQEKFGKALINFIMPFVRSLQDWANSKAGEEAIQRLIQGFQIFTQVVGNIVTATWPTFISIFQFVMEAIKTAIPIIQNLAINVLGALKQAWEFLSPPLKQLWDDLQPLIKSLGTLYQDIKPVLKIIGTTVALGFVGALYLLIKAVDLAVIGITKFSDWAHDNKPILAAVGTALGVIGLQAGILGAKKLLDGLLAFGAKSWIAVAPWLALALKAAAIAGVLTAIYKAADFLTKKTTGSSLVDQLKSIPDYLYLKKFGELPGNAMGTDFWKGGPTWVGERGPELVNLPRGSSVTPNDKVGGDTFNINLAGIMARSRADLREIGKDIIRSIDEERRAKGEATIL